MDGSADGPLRFFSSFDSGNLADVTTSDPLLSKQMSQFNSPTETQSSSEGISTSTASSSTYYKKDAGNTEYNYYLSVAPDCQGTGHENNFRSWFYFGVNYVGPPDFGGPTSKTSKGSGSSAGSIRKPSLSSSVAKKVKVNFTIVNFSATNRIFDHDNRPVYWTDQRETWERLPTPLSIHIVDKYGNVNTPPAECLAPQLSTGVCGGVFGGLGCGNGLSSPLAANSDGFAMNGTGGSSSSVGGVIGCNTTPILLSKKLSSPSVARKISRSLYSSSMRVTWSYTFTRDDEIVYFAMNYPYPYRYLQDMIQAWEKDAALTLSRYEYKLAATTAAAAQNSSSLLSTTTSSSSSLPATKIPMPPPPPSSNSVGTPVTKPSSSTSVSSLHPPNNNTVLSPRHQSSSEKSQSKNPIVPEKLQATSSSSSSLPQQPPGSASYNEECVYFVSETLCFSNGGRKVDLLTITGYNDIVWNEREPRINAGGTVPVHNPSRPRPHVFNNKAFVLITARVHPGETPGSHVLHGIINYLLNAQDPRAKALRKHFVFKIVPMLNPDGVALGHYRTNTMGENLNRKYDDPDVNRHPSIAATRQLFLFLSNGATLTTNTTDGSTLKSPTDGDAEEDRGTQQPLLNTTPKTKNTARKKGDQEAKEGEEDEDEREQVEDNDDDDDEVHDEFLDRRESFEGGHQSFSSLPDFAKLGSEGGGNTGGNVSSNTTGTNGNNKSAGSVFKDRRLALYLDLHAHASKRGCFVFGNAQDDHFDQLQTLLFPKLIALNSPHFDFTSCDFTTRSMLAKNRRDGLTKEGTGRVALPMETGLIFSYTLEVSYNMGLSYNHIVPVDVPLMPLVTEGPKSSTSSGQGATGGGGGSNSSSVSNKNFLYAGGRNFSQQDGNSLSSNSSSSSSSAVMRKGVLSSRGGSLHALQPITPATDVGQAIVIALLDLYHLNPYSRLPNTTFRSCAGVRGWIDRQVKQLHTEQQREEISSRYAQKRKTTKATNKSLERLGAVLALPAMNTYKHQGKK